MYDLDLLRRADGSGVDDQLAGVFIVFDVAHDRDGVALFDRVHRSGFADGVEHLDGRGTGVVGDINGKNVFVSGFGDLLFEVEHVAPDDHLAGIGRDGADGHHLAADLSAVQRTDGMRDQLRQREFALAQLYLRRAGFRLLFADVLADLLVSLVELRRLCLLLALDLLLRVLHRLAVFVAVLGRLERAGVADPDRHIELLGDHARQHAVKALGVKDRLFDFFRVPIF